LVLDDTPTDDHAIRAVRAIGETREELRLEAVEILEPVLRTAGRIDDLVTGLELRLQALSDPLDRARPLHAVAQVLDADLDRAADAEAALLREPEDTPEDASLHAEIERLAEKWGDSGGWVRYCDALGQRAGAIFDATVAKDLYLRLGRIAEDRLKDD